MITVSQLSKSFEDRRLWSGIDLEVGAGEMFAVVGPSGSGKSTLLNCIGLLDRASSGRIEVDGQDIAGLGNRRRRVFRRKCLGYLFQNYALIENASVRFNLDIATAGQGLSRRQRRDVYEEALERVGLSGRSDDSVFRLSGGEQQRVALARLIVKRPRIVLADEPTGSLDRRNARIVVDLLRQLAEGGCAVVVATHDERVESACDSTVRLGE